jgi:hypothetical protein
MKLDEIKLIPGNSEHVFDLPETIANHGEFIGKSDHREIYSCSFTNDRKYFIFFNKDEDGISSYLVLYEEAINDRDAAIIVRSWTRKALRNKGYLSALVKFIRDFLKMQVVSDSEHTPSSQAFWVSLSKKFKVRLLNFTTKGIFDGDIYSAYKHDNYRLIIESGTIRLGEGFIHHNKKHSGQWKEPFLKPYIYFGDGDI